ncbi:MAG: glycosyltransferase family 39 protein [bacterium]
MNIKTKKLCIFLILIIAAIIRLYYPAFRSLWGDEVDSLFRIYNFSQHNFHYEPIGLLERLHIALTSPLKGHHLPSYYLLLSLWTALFGVGEVAARSLSVIFGLLCIPMTYLLAKEFYDERVAMFSSFLMAISGFAVFYSQEIRPYSLMMFVAAASIYYFRRMVQEDKRFAPRLGYIAASFVLVFSHLFGVLALSAQSLYLIILWFNGRRQPGILMAALSQAIVYLLALPVLLPMFFSGIKMAAGLGQDFPFTQIPGILKLCLNLFALGFGESLAPWHWSVVIPAGLVYLGLFVLLLTKNRDNKTLTLLVFLFWPIVTASFLIKVTLPKYLIVILPVFIVLLGRAIAAISSARIRMTVLVIIVIAQLVSLGNYFRIEEYHNANQMEPWRQVSTSIADQFQAGDIIAVNSYDVSFRLLQYYLNILPNGNYPIFLIRYPASEDFSSEEGNLPIIITAAELSKHRSKRVWLVSHLRDDRKNPLGAIPSLKRGLLTEYQLAVQKKYLPYEKTLIAKLPFFQSREGEYRIVVERYDKIRINGQ